MEHFDSGNRKNGFDRDWRFMPDLPPLCDDCHGNTDVYSVTRTGKRCRYAVSGFDDSGWRKVHLPHDWLVGQDFDTDGLNSQGFFRRGYAWYRKEFRLLSDCRGKQILLCFDGIAGKSEIYINGSLIKRNFSSYNTFTVADTVSVTVYAVDKDGNPVPDADNLIRFSVTGSAQIAGCGNGDPTSHENDTLPERRLFAGMCAVLVRSGEKDETICLSAESDGLTAGHAVLTVGKC